MQGGWRQGLASVGGPWWGMDLWCGRRSIFNSGLGSSRVALPTKDMAIQRETAVVICLNGQGFPTVLTLVTLHMKVLIQRDYSHSLIPARLRHDGLRADRAPRSILLVIVRNTVGLIGLVHNEGSALQGTGADHTGEAMWVVGFASGPQHAVRDGLPTSVALLQSVSVAALTIRCPLQAIELLSLQLLLTLMTSEAGDMEQLSQCTDCGLCSGQWLTAFATGLIYRHALPLRVLHVLHQLLGQLLQLFHLLQGQGAWASRRTYLVLVLSWWRQRLLLLLN